MTKLYSVAFIIKANNEQTRHAVFCEAENKKEAEKKVKAYIYQTTGRNAFTPYAKQVNADEICYIDGTTIYAEKTLDDFIIHNKRYYENWLNRYNDGERYTATVDDKGHHVVRRVRPIIHNQVSFIG